MVVSARWTKDIGLDSSVVEHLTSRIANNHSIHSEMRVIFSVGDKNLRIRSPTWQVKILSDFSRTRLRFDSTFNFYFATNKILFRVRLFIGSTSYEVARVNIMCTGNLFREYHVKSFFLCYCFQHFIENVGPKLSIWASKT